MLKKQIAGFSLICMCLISPNFFAEEAADKKVDGHTLKEWIDALKKNDTRFEAEAALPHLGAPGVRALLHLDRAGAVAQVDLSQLDEAELKAAAPALIEALSDKDVLIRRPAPAWIEQLPREVRKSAIPALIKALSDEDVPVRRWTAETLGKIGSDAKDAVPQLIQALQHQDTDFQAAAMGALGGIGPAAKDAVPLLIARFRNARNDFERCHIPLVLGMIGPVTPEVMPTMLAALKDPGFNTRSFTAQGLGNMHATEAIPALVAVLTNPQEMSHVRNSAAEALGKLGTSKESAAALAGAARDPKSDWQSRGAAMSALVLVDADATTALAILQENLADSDALVLISTADAIGSLGARGQPAAAALGKMLLAQRAKQEGFTTARLQAVEALGKMGANAEVIKILESATTDPDALVARVAKENLHKIKK